MAAQRRRLRSSTVILGGMGVVAAALTSCSSEPDRRCVDRDSYDWANGYRITSDSNCSSGGTGSGTVNSAWYYDSDKSGNWADDGTFSRDEAVDRNGFGCSGSGGG